MTSGEITLIRLPVTVEFDIPVNRRTRIHSVLDGNADPIFHSRSLTDVLDYLIENEVHDFELLDEDRHYAIKLSRVLPIQQPLKG